ncbi:unnamed protein product [Bursaphelenchus xylophilus]|uniref:(pine wood nematode) hypothetical protein n=1 Tax=Bursaphelenchus xylophilus TaxID=6326 RepID=A0A1I7SWN3_BURXY|nr:unnamed protein product [Bursaphelenchus xylophilus]CAG9099704.1 unnamed protein product [Bursaphelenchus xylophilus]
MLVSKAVDDPSTAASPTHVDLSWHPIRDVMAVASHSPSTGGYVSFVTHKGGDAFYTLPARQNERPLKLLWHLTDPKVAVGWDSGRISIIEPFDQHEKEIESAERASAIRVLSWHTDGQTLISGDEDGKIFYHTGTNRNEKVNVTKKIELGQGITSISVKQLKRQKERLDNNHSTDELTEILNVNRRRMKEIYKVEEEEMNSVRNEDMETVLIVTTSKYRVYLIKENKEPAVVYTTDSAAKRVLSMKNRPYVIILTEGLMFYQLVFENETVKDKIKVKLSGRREFFDAIQVDSDTVAICYGDREIRIWNLQSEDSAVYRIDQEKGYQGTENVVSLSYCNKKNCISGGTLNGKVATWKRHKETYEISVDQQWRLQPSLSVGTKVVSMAWSNSSPTLAVNSGDSVQIFRTQGVEYHVNKDFAVVQTSPQIVSLVKITEPIESQEVQFSYALRGLRLGGGNLITWDDSQVYVNQIINSESAPIEIKQTSLFKASVNDALCYNQQLYSVESGQLCVRTLQGTLKKTLTFREVEGEVQIIDMNSKWLCVGSSQAYIRIYNMDDSNLKQIYQSNQLSMNIEDFERFVNIRINSLGNRVSITMKRKDSVDERLFIWDAEADLLGYFSFVDGLTDAQQYESKLEENNQDDRPKTAAAKRIERYQSRYRMPDYLPGNHYWDQTEGRFLVCEAVRIDSDDSNNVLLSLFVTSENGIQVNDIQSKSIKADQMIYLQVPYIFFLKNIEVDEEDDIGIERSLSRLIIRRSLREFVGIEATDNEAIEAMLNFSYYLCAEQMDNAFKAIKFIKNDSVWDHMARMCVKTRRMDVAIVCLGHMKRARSVRALKESIARGDSTELQAAVLAMELDMIDEAVSIYINQGRYDLLNKLYQCQNKWNEAFEIAKKHDRIHLRNTHFNYASYLESIGEIEQAIENYEKAQTHHSEVPRMLSEEPKAVDLYIKRKRERELYLWWARYLESVSDLEGARNYYKYANDHLSVVRIYCYHDRIDEAVDTVNKTDDRAAAFHLARYFESKGDVEKAVKYFGKASSYSSAIRLAKEHGLNDQLANFALHAGENEQIETAKYYEQQPGHVDKAVMLYHKAGQVGKALDLAFRTEQISALDPIIRDLGPNSDPNVLERAAHFFAQNQRENEAVQLLVYAKKFQEAVDLCLQTNVIIDENLAEILTPPKTDPNRQNLLIELAKVCMQQGNYHYAAKKYTQAGKKLEAMKALLRSGDTPKIILYANTAKNKDIYRMVGNFLQSLDWKEDATLMRQIENFYIKANAMDSLAAFYESCGQLEIDDYRDYDKAITAYNEAVRCWNRKGDKDGDLDEKETKMRDRIKKKITRIKTFIETKETYEKDPGEALRRLTEMSEQPEIDGDVRLGDIYALLIAHNVKRENWKKAYQLVQQYQSKKTSRDITDYLSMPILDEICDHNDAPRFKTVDEKVDEIDDTIEYSHALRRKMSHQSENDLSD